MTPRHALAVIWSALTSAQRRRFVALQFVSLFMAASTVLGLAGVMTFLALLADPGLIGKYAALNWLWRLLGGSEREFLVKIGGVFIALLFVSASINVAGLHAMGRFAYSVGDRIREALFAEYLRRDYLFHLGAGAARLMDNVLYQADRVTNTLLSGLQLIANSVLTLLVIASIAIVSPAVAVLGVLAVAGSYFLFFRIIRRRIGRNGRVQGQLSAERIAVVKQALFGIKYLLIAGAQPAFRQRFGDTTRTLSHTFADTQFIGQFPKYVLECAAGAVLIACAAFASGAGGGGAWLAQLSFIGFAGFRLLPAFQQMYYALVVLRANRPAIENLAAQLEGCEAAPEVVSLGRGEKSGFHQRVELIGVSYRYSSDTPFVLSDATLTLEAGAAIGIVGASGCGKTTLVDLILGLLDPVEGRIEIDGEPLQARRIAAWQQSIGYVPQNTMILDSPVRENIAFGVDPRLIDDARVREVASQAGASEFIESLPGGYGAVISGSGSSLSGGQVQRLAIARALYHRPGLLVLDEATSSLDAATERAIIDTVIRNRGSRTLLIVAHGAAVIGACDRVYELRDGRLAELCGPAFVASAARAR